jgi:hypothetical protein
MALAGDTALIGAPEHQHDGGPDLVGAAYVFVRSGSVWSEQAELIVEDGEVGDRLGTSVALSGDTAILGAATNRNYWNLSGF